MHNFDKFFDGLKLDETGLQPVMVAAFRELLERAWNDGHLTGWKESLATLKEGLGVTD